MQKANNHCRANSNAGYASIALGGDDIGNNYKNNKFALEYKYARPLSEDIWNLYKDNKSSFHNKDSYATTRKNTYTEYLNDEGRSYSQNWAKGRGAISIGSERWLTETGQRGNGNAVACEGNYSAALKGRDR